MATQAEPDMGERLQSIHALFRDARREVIHGASDVHEVRLELDGPPLRARSRLLTSQSLLFVLGENRADEDLWLRHEGAAPLVAVHAPLRGTATSSMDGLGRMLTRRAGELQLFASPTSHSTVQMRAHVTNQAFRVAFQPALLRSLAARNAELELLATHVETRRPFCARPVALLPAGRVLDEAAELFDSEHYGELRPLFLESRAVGWLATALAATRSVPSLALSSREVDRMHDARDFLLARLAEPPTLAEVSRAVGTNEFALKRQFKAVFGEPVYGYLLRVRLAHARRLLEDTSLTVKEIAAAVGYGHANHFGTAFRRWLGVTPGNYRAGRRR